MGNGNLQTPWQSGQSQEMRRITSSGRISSIMFPESLEVIDCEIILEMVYHNREHSVWCFCCDRCRTGRCGCFRLRDFDWVRAGSYFLDRTQTKKNTLKPRGLRCGPRFFGVGADLVSARFLCHGTVAHKVLPYKAFSKIFNKNFILHYGRFRV